MTKQKRWQNIASLDNVDKIYNMRHETNKETFLCKNLPMRTEHI